MCYLTPAINRIYFQTHYLYFRQEFGVSRCRRLFWSPQKLQCESVVCCDAQNTSKQCHYTQYIVSHFTAALCDRLKKEKFSHTRHRASGPELIPVYRQSSRRWLFKSSHPGGRLPLFSTRHAYLHRKRSPDGAYTDCGGERLIAAHYSFIDPQGIKN